MPPLRQRLGELRLRVRDAGYWLRLRRVGRDTPGEYRDYLAIQLRRSLSKRRTTSGAGALLLIAQTVGALREPGRAKVL